MKHSLAISIIIFCFFSVFQFSYRYYIDGKISFLNQPLQPVGSGQWVKTWFSTQEAVRIYWNLNHGKGDFESIPERAFGDETERQKIKEAYRIYKNNGNKYTKEVDEIFMWVANKRKEEMSLPYFIALRSWFTIRPWVYPLVLNRQLRATWNTLPDGTHIFVYGFYFVLRILVHLFALISIYFLYKNIKTNHLGLNEILTILMLSLIITRTAMFGFLFGASEHRYIHAAWPAMIWCAVYTVYIFNLKKLLPNKWKEQPSNS